MPSIRISVILPKKPFATQKWLDEIARVQRQTSVPRLKKLFNQTVFGWSHKPDFGWAQQRSSDAMSITMYPSGQYADKWELVNAGSPAHRIPRSGTVYMRFRGGYRSATTPGQLQSRRAYRSGKYETRFVINHKGFAPRKFDELIAQEYENPFIGDMQDALDKVAKSF